VFYEFAGKRRPIKTRIVIGKGVCDHLVALMSFVLTYILKEIYNQILNQCFDLSLYFIGMVVHEEDQFFVDEFYSLGLA